MINRAAVVPAVNSPITTSLDSGIHKAGRLPVNNEIIDENIDDEV